MTILLVSAVAALTTANSHLPRPVEDDESEELPGAGIIVRSEVVHIQIPEALWELARVSALWPKS